MYSEPMCPKINARLVNKGAFGHYEVDLEFPKDLYIPVLMAREGGKLVGTLKDKTKCVFHQRELQVALEQGYTIIIIHRALHFRTTTEIFEAYTDCFHQTKLNASKKPSAVDLKTCGYEDFEAWQADCKKRFGFVPEPEFNAGLRYLSKL